MEDDNIFIVPQQSLWYTPPSTSRQLPPPPPLYNISQPILYPSPPQYCHIRLIKTETITSPTIEQPTSMDPLSSEGENLNWEITPPLLTPTLKNSPSTSICSSPQPIIIEEQRPPCSPSTSAGTSKWFSAPSPVQQIEVSSNSSTRSSPKLNIIINKPPYNGAGNYHKLKTPKNKQEAQNQNAILKGKARPKGLYRTTRHCEATFFCAPGYNDWRCIECYQQIKEDWDAIYLHNVGLKKSHYRPLCPGCGDQVCFMDTVTKCKDCRLILNLNSKEIEKGKLFKVEVKRGRENKNS